MKAWEAAILGGAVDEFLRRYDGLFANSIWTRQPLVDDLKAWWMDAMTDARKRLVEMLEEKNVPKVTREFQDVCSLRLTRDIREN